MKIFIYIQKLIIKELMSYCLFSFIKHMHSRNYLQFLTYLFQSNALIIIY
jgi:hypothetical protein